MQVTPLISFTGPHAISSRLPLSPVSLTAAPSLLHLSPFIPLPFSRPFHLSLPLPPSSRSRQFICILDQVSSSCVYEQAENPAYSSHSLHASCMPAISQDQRSLIFDTTADADEKGWIDYESWQSQMRAFCQTIGLKACESTHVMLLTCKKGRC